MSTTLITDSPIPTVLVDLFLVPPSSFVFNLVINNLLLNPLLGLIQSGLALAVAARLQRDVSKASKSFMETIRAEEGGCHSPQQPRVVGGSKTGPAILHRGNPVLSACNLSWSQRRRTKGGEVVRLSDVHCFVLQVYPDTSYRRCHPERQQQGLSHSGRYGDGLYPRARSF